MLCLHVEMGKASISEIQRLASHAASCGLLHCNATKPNKTLNQTLNPMHTRAANTGRPILGSSPEILLHDDLSWILKKQLGACADAGGDV